MNDELMNKEINEAIAAGEKSLGSLRQALQQLKSAGNWGLLDMFGGGLVSGMMKHSKLDHAVQYMEDAKRDLKRFQIELRDVNQVMNLQLDIGGFLTFADFFFDGVVADFLVQSKINDAKLQVETAISQVDKMLRNLRGYQ